MYEDLRKRSVKKALVAAATLWAVGVVIIIAQWSSLSTLLRPTVNLNEASASEVTAGKRASVKVNVLVDYYAETTADSSIVEREYFLPVGEEEYMGIAVPKKYLSDANWIMEATQQYMNGETEALDDTPVLSVTGTIVELSAESLQYYQEYVSELGWSEEEAQAFLPYCLMVDQIGTEEPFTLWVVCGFAVILITVGFFLLMQALAGKRQKMILAYCDSTGNREMAMNRLDTFYRNTPEVSGIRVASDFFLYGGGGADNILLETQKILWVYPHVTRHSVNLIPTGKTYALKLITMDGKSYMISMKNKRASDDAMDAIGHTIPDIFFGYDERLEKALRQDLVGMVNSVLSRRQSAGFQ